VGFVVAVTPILGFLGTVVHFGTALSGMTIEHMHEELSNVVTSLGTGFNTTTVALAASMIAMFAKFMCERADKGIDARIDRLVDRELLNRFEVKSANLGPLAALLEGANQEFHASVQKSLQQQLAYWAQALETLFAKFDQRQKHEEQRWQAMCLHLQERQQKQEASSEQQLHRVLAVADQRQEQHLAQIQRVLEQASQFSGEVGTLAKTLQSIARGEGRLADLQRTLTENLQVLHETNQIDAALHGLTAAIHLLTVRHPDAQHGKAA
jgi:biopolymer transport protein ExbB/TolQ